MLGTAQRAQNAVFARAEGIEPSICRDDLTALVGQDPGGLGLEEGFQTVIDVFPVYGMPSIPGSPHALTAGRSNVSMRSSFFG